MMIGSRAEGQLIKVAFRSRRVGIMRGEGWRLREEAAEMLAARRILRDFFWKGENLGRQLHVAPARRGCTNKGCRCEESKNVHGGESESLFSFPSACVCTFLKYSGANGGSGLSFAVGALWIKPTTTTPQMGVVLQVSQIRDSIWIRIKL